MQADIPKQYLSIGGLPILEHTLRALLASDRIAGVVVATQPDDPYLDAVPSLQDPRVFVTRGGAERADSVLAGLQALSNGAAADFLSLPESLREPFVDTATSTWVLVHDAARPCLPLSALDALIEQVVETGCGAILAQRCSDTIKQVDDQGLVVKTLDRSQLWRAQTPQMFPLGALQSALEEANTHGVAVTDEASAMEYAGLDVALVEGPACNIKITVPEDLPLAELYLRASRSEQQ